MRRNGPSSPGALSTKLTELSYRGEGNNTIVLSDDKQGMIYRFRKTSLSGDKEEASHRKKFKGPKCLSESFSFRHNVMRGYLGDEFVTPMEILEVPSKLLHRLDKRLQADRPDFRLTKSIDTGYRNVLRAPDACMMPVDLRRYGVGPTICVEVKPKKGFIHLDRASWQDEPSCKFCMVQYHPKKTKLWPQRSSYCPCDLFSGDRLRMRRALLALIRDPQINFRSFLDSRPQYTCNLKLDPYIQFLSSFLQVEHGTDELVELLIDGLLFPFPRSNDGPGPPERNHTVPHTLSCAEGALKAKEEGNMVISDGDKTTQSSLSSDCILGRIFHLQLRDSLGVRGIHPHLQRVRTHLENTKSTWQWNEPQQLDVCDCENDKELQNSIQLVEDYLIASVAYDCSLMITLQKAKPNVPPNLPTLRTRQGLQFLLNVVVVDLDPKSFSKVSNTALSWEEEIEAAFRANRSSSSGDLSRSSSSCSTSTSSFRPSSRLTSTSSSPAPSSPKSCRLSRPL